MARDIEEFLKRAAERRRQQQQAQNNPPGESKPPRTLKPKRTPAREVRRQAAQRPPRQDDVRFLENPYSGETIDEHVRQHISVDDVTESASQLGDGVSNREDMVSDRLQQKFDSDVGHLGHKGIGGKRDSVQDETTAVTAANANELAENLVAMLQNPKNVAQAILIAEILKRPEI